MVWEEIPFPFLEVTEKSKRSRWDKEDFLKKKSIPRLAQGYRDEKAFNQTIYTL